MFGFFSSMVGGSSGLLDQVTTGVKSGWSLRKLKASAIYAIRVRRSSDNAEMDIGFSGNELNIIALLAFVGANDGFVVKIYDQSGNGMDWVQTGSAAAQFKIVSAGTLITKNGKPALAKDGVNDFMSVASSTTYYKFLHDGTIDYGIYSVTEFGNSSNPDTRYTLLSSASATTAVGAWMLYDDRSSSSNNNVMSAVIYRGASGTTTATALSQNAITPSQLNQLTILGSPGNATAADRAYFHVNGGSALKTNVSTSSTSTANAAADLRLGATNAGSVFMLGSFCEMIMLTGDQSAFRSSIEGNQKAYWGTP